MSRKSREYSQSQRPGGGSSSNPDQSADFLDAGTMAGDNENDLNDLSVTSGDAFSAGSPINDAAEMSDQTIEIMAMPEPDMTIVTTDAMVDVPDAGALGADFPATPFFGAADVPAAASPFEKPYEMPAPMMAETPPPVLETLPPPALPPAPAPVAALPAPMPALPAPPVPTAPAAKSSRSFVYYTARAVSRAVRTITHNPVPVALAATGIGLIVRNNREEKRRNARLSTRNPLRTAASTIKDAASTTGDTIKDAASTAGDTIKDVASTTGENIKDAAYTAGDTIKDAAYSTGETIKDAASTAGDTIKDVTRATASTIKDAAHATGEAFGQIKDRAENAFDRVEDVFERVEDRVDVVKDQIEDRAEETLDRVGETTRALLNNAVDAVGQTASGAFRTVRTHPIPAALSAAGLAWLISSARRARSSASTSGSYGRTTSSYQPDRSYQSDLSYQPDQSSPAGQRDRSDQPGKIDRPTQSSRSTMPTERGLLGRAVNENPLALGTIALVLGAAAGLAFPESQRENEILGKTRDQLADKASGLAQNLACKVQAVASEGVDTAVQESKNQGLTIEAPATENQQKK